METLISNLADAKSVSLAFGIVWVVFLVYILRLIQTRKKLGIQMDRLKNIRN